jgi:hypothetical protein
VANQRLEYYKKNEHFNILFKEREL